MTTRKHVLATLFLLLFSSIAHAGGLDSLRFSDSSGQSHSLKDFEGKVVLLNLWATWCKPCLEEMPALNRLQGAMKNENVEVIALNTNVENPQLLEQFYQRHNMQNLTAYYDPDQNALEILHFNAIPVSLIIDRNGKVVQQINGPREWDKAGIQNYLKSLNQP